MKILLIGGTGTISSAITRQLANSEHDLWLLNRGTRRAELPKGVKQVIGDIHSETQVRQMLGDQQFDVVCDFIGFKPEHVERDIRLFNGRTRQYVYISSASAYHKPSPHYIITEGTTLSNPFWQYSRDKIACEEILMQAYKEQSFPVTIVRPSHTYGERGVPTSVHGPKGCWQVLKRMLDGKPVIIQGDGTSLWTLTWNEDFAQGFIGLLGNPKAIGESFQIMSDETLTWNQIFQTIAEALGVPFKPYYVSSEFLATVAPKEWDFTGNLIGDKSVSVVFDCTKLKRTVPDFCAKTFFSEGVRRSIGYILAHPELQVEEPDFDAWCDRVIEVQEVAKKSFTHHE
ncbi:MAG: SDR family oxidoreductase [Prevotella sp.]|nr:SDR family oxidoreductase [Prevotella sp.]